MYYICLAISSLVYYINSLLIQIDTVRYSMRVMSFGNPPLTSSHKGVIKSCLYIRIISIVTTLTTSISNKRGL